MRKHVALMVIASLAAAGVVARGGQGSGTTGDNTGVMTGVVTSANGPEAGVWVIAETVDVQTKLRKIVVTNDEGRFLLPELPKATFNVWVRGYGLVDSTPVSASPNQDLRLTAVIAPNRREAAKVYPSSYWGSLLDIPKASEFPGTGPNGNGISPEIKTQGEWVAVIKACQRCHQVGSHITRTIPDRDKFESSVAAWDHRVQRGQRAGEMNSFMTRFGRQRGLEMFAGWSDRIAAGEVPAVAPPRPKGIERNVVLTMWNWGENTSLMHDEMSTDKRNPRLNAMGPIYGLDFGNDWLTVVDPKHHTAELIRTPLRAPRSQVPPGFQPRTPQPYRYFGEEIVWDNPAHPHNPMMDAKGRIWITQAIRGPQNPAWCMDGDNKFARYFPLARASSHVSYYDPKTQKFTLIDTCVGTHHLQFAEDANDTLYLSHPGTPAIGWVNTKLYDQTGDEVRANGWCPIVVDSNGDGKITKPWNEPGDAADPARDTRIQAMAYGLIPHPTDGSVWAAMDEVSPGRIFRLHPGNNPPETCISEVYELPMEKGVFRPRGIDVDRNGVIWTGLAGSAHIASFERRKCRVLNGPEAARSRHCDEGWTYYPAPGVTYKNTNINTDFFYYNWVDQFNTLGLGNNIPIATGSSSDSLLVLKPDTREWVVLRVPYPLGFNARGLDGRIDDPTAGWKGRGLYATYGMDAAWHVEGGPVETGNLVKFQIRPDPLAR